MATNGFVSPTHNISVEDYKKWFVENNFKTNNYQIAKFIDFLTRKEKLIREIGELTGLKKSQIHYYKKIIKSGKINELKRAPFRKVLKNCDEPAPKVEPNLVQQIEDLNTDDEVGPDIHHRAHYFSSSEYSPGKSTYIKKDVCDKCYCSIAPGGLPGQNQVHIPDIGVSVFTFYRLREIVEHHDELNFLRDKIFELEEKLYASERENERLKEEFEAKRR